MTATGLVCVQCGGLLTAVSCSSDLAIKVWDANDDWKNVRTVYGHEHCVSCVRFLSDQQLVSASRDRSVKVWDLSNGCVPCEAVD